MVTKGRAAELLRAHAAVAGQALADHLEDPTLTPDWCLFALMRDRITVVMYEDGDVLMYGQMSYSRNHITIPVEKRLRNGGQSRVLS